MPSRWAALFLLVPGLIVVLVAQVDDAANHTTLGGFKNAGVGCTRASIARTTL